MAACPALTRAQATAGADTPARNDLVLVNPFGIVFNVLSGEYEHVISKSATVGVGSTYYSPSGFTYLTGEAKLRYYPAEHAPDGFSLALAAGVTRVSGDLICFDTCDNRATNRPTVGFELDYNWLLGPTRRFVVGAGLGAKRFFGDKTSGSIDGIPTARLAVGIAF